MLGHYQHASETPFKWCFAGRPVLACILWYLDPLSSHQLKLSGSAYAAKSGFLTFQGGHIA